MRQGLEVAFDKVPKAIIGVLILVGVLIICANVVSRYLFSAAIFWAEEILIFMVVGLLAFSAVTVSYNGAHLNMDLLLARARGRLKRVIEGFTTLVFVGCCGFVVVQSFEIVAAFRRTGTVSLAAGVPLVVPHTILLIGFALMIVAVCVRAVMAFRAPPGGGNSDSGTSGSEEGDEPWRG